MSCSCIKNSFDLKIEYTDCKTLVLSDLSEYMRGDFFSENEELLVLVTPMALGKTKEILVKTNKKNIYTSFDIIGIEDKCLSDDVLCFEVTSCGVTYRISRAYLCSTYCKIQQLIAKAKTEVEFSFIRTLKSLAEQVEVNVKFNKIETATELLELLNKKLKNVQCGSC